MPQGAVIRPIDRLIYDWESSVWEIGGVLDSPQLDQGEAQALSNRLWLAYRHLGAPAFDTLPSIIVDPSARYAGLASYEHHRITLQPLESRKPVLIHEICHLLSPGARHGPEWVTAVLALWEAELNLPKAIALQAGQRLCLG